jgi:hypothetical protein
LPLAGLLACGGDSPPPAPLPHGEPDGTGSGTIGTITVSGGLPTAGGGGVDAHCLPAGEGDQADDTATNDGFKFDVGGDDSAEFPVDCDEVETSLTNLGCEFWAVDLPNDYRGTPMSPPAADQQFAIVVANASALAPATVQVFVGADTTMPVASVDVPAGGVQEIPLDSLNIDPVQTTVDGTAYRLVSDVPITAYQFNPLDNTVQVYSNDASLLLPVHTLANDYTAVTGDAILLSMSQDDPMPVNSGAFISVVATEDGTDVEIDATASLAGPTTSATIDRGRVFTVISTTNSNQGNLTGSRVVSSAPVAVFSGNMATAVPADAAVCCADHLEHQMPPIEAWGTAYAVAPPASPLGGPGDPAEYRIVAAFDDTELLWCPERPDGAPEVLMAGESVAFQTDQPFTVVADPDKAFSVTQFLLSFQAISPDQPGDPAMIVVPSVEQHQRRYVFVVPAGYVDNYVTVAARGEGTISLDDATIPADDMQELGVVRGQQHRYVHLDVGVGAHTIEADVPVAITVVGYDEAVSYGYPGGAGLRVIAIPPVAG